MIITIIDIPVKFIPFIRISTEAYFLPFYLCPIAFLFSVISLKMKKNRIGYIAIVCTTMLMLLEVFFMIAGFKYLIH